MYETGFMFGKLGEILLNKCLQEKSNFCLIVAQKIKENVF